MLRSAVRAKRWFQASRAQVSTRDSLAKAMVRKAAKPVARLFGLRELSLIKLRTLREKCPKGSPLVANIAWPAYGERDIHRRDIFENLGRIAFEGSDFSAFDNPDSYLRAIYGDYMKLPPSEQRVGHELCAWRVSGGETS